MTPNSSAEPWHPTGRPARGRHVYVDDEIDTISVDGAANVIVHAATV